MDDIYRPLPVLNSWESNPFASEKMPILSFYVLNSIHAAMFIDFQEAQD